MKLTKNNVIAWNTGRFYSNLCQRIAAVQMDGGVFFSDQDRKIAYFLPDCPFRPSAIMERYDSNDRCQWGLPASFDGNRWDLISKLNDFSANITHPNQY